MKFSTVVLQILLTGVLMALAGFVTAQQAYPNKPIRMIVPFPPGGTADIVARLVGQKLAESVGQQVLMDNRGGATTIIGSEALLKSPPDGYTVMLTSVSHIITPLLMRTSYDAVKDFAAVATVDICEFFLVIHPSLPANNLHEFISLAKAKPGQLNYASSGSGSIQHLAAEQLGMIGGIRMQHIPYKGGGQILTDLIGGQVHAFFLSPIAAIPHIKSGKIRAIAIGGDARLQALPDVPTFAEAGQPGVGVKLWHAVFAPAGTPKAVIDKLAGEFARMLAQPDTKEKLAGQGMDPWVTTSDQFSALIRTDMAKYAQIIKAANIKLEN